MKIAAAFLALLAFSFAGCTSVNVDRNPRVDLTKFQRFYVERRLADNNQVAEAIAAELRARGFEATAGPLTMMPERVDAVVNYHDEWAWDFKSYLIQLHIQIRSPHRNQTFATGLYRQPSPVTKPLPEVVQILFDSMLKKP